MAGRVAHLLSQRPSWTGSGVALDAIVRATDEAGWEQVAVVGTSADDPLPSVGTLPVERISPLVFEHAPLSYLLPGMSDVMPYPSSRFSELTDLQLIVYRHSWRSHVAQVVAEFQPDVIHCHHIWLMSALVKDIAERTPVVTHCHGTGLRQLELCPHLADEVRSGCRRNDAFVVLHEGHAETIERELGVDRSRIEIVGSGFRQDIFHEGDDTTRGPTVTYAGKLSNAKGLPSLLDAVEQLSQGTPDLVLNVAGSGSGSEADALRQRMEAMENVVYHEQLDQQRLADLLRASSVFALPSFYEGLPLVLVEAAACGCRLVSTALPGVVNQLALQLGDAIELVPLPRLEGTDRPIAEDLPEFVSRLALAIESSLARPPVENPQQFIAGMTWDAVFQRIQAVWRRLIAGG